MGLGAFAKFAKVVEKGGKENNLSEAQRLSADAPEYWPGHLYVGLRLYGIGVPMLRFGDSKKISSSSGSGGGDLQFDALHMAGIESQDYAGYERILAALGKKAGMYMQEWTTKTDE
jgi:hypothetical protein